MPYPEEIVAAMTTKYHLSEFLQQQLRNSLLIEELRPLVEAGRFNPEDLLIRLNLQGELYVSVLSPIAAKLVLTDPTTLTRLKEAALANPEAFKEWNNIKQDLEAVSALPRSRTTQRKILATEIGSKLAPLQKFIFSHPVFIAEHFELAAQLFQYINALVEPIKEAAEKYFRSLFEGMGRKIMEIIFPDPVPLLRRVIYEPQTAFRTH